jgi:hypothetical protein
MKTDPNFPGSGTVFRMRANGMPSRRGALLFSLKALVFRAKRGLLDLSGSAPRRLGRGGESPHQEIVAESRSALYADVGPSEWALQAGKVQNLRVAARAFDGLVVPAGETFSFWANLGRATRQRGFVRGRELREGCVIPNIGGGLCQISNSLYDAALQAGMEILERHAHSRQVPGSSFAGRDATVFWNYVDLRFRSEAAFRITVELSATEIIVRFHGVGVAATPRPSATCEPSSGGVRILAESCETCGIAQCFRHASAVSLPQSSGSVWMVDAWHPEIDGWIAAHREAADHLLLPLDSRRWRFGPYRWSSSGFAAVRQAPWTVVKRSAASRRLAGQGAARQKALLRMDAEMARALSRQVPPLATHLNVSQNLLPFLWRDGLLGGRTFDVLMTRYPLHEMEAILDRAASAHPESRTLADFRADPDLVEAERQALAAARHWITPHLGIAALAGDRARVVDWKLPSETARPRGKWVVFPASTLGRKGAYELRAAARSLSLPVRICGPVLESPDFWEGLTISRAEGDWLDQAAVVVLPAWIEHQPRRLLRAQAAGVPVIASDACGLPPQPGLTVVPVGDADALARALGSVIGAKETVVVQGNAA